MAMNTKAVNATIARQGKRIDWFMGKPKARVV
jgi:hypothetical protein